MSEVRIGVIGGSGLYGMEGLQVEEEKRIETPFGEPSDPFVVGDLDGNKVAFLARHGRGHRILPSELNFRANIYGFKVLGVEWLVSVSAVGSMKIDYRPTDIVIPDQFFDRTRHREDTFFGNGLVAHVSLAHPICPVLHEIFFEGAKQAGARVHKGGTYICMEGPQFSTRAESEIYRQWGVDIIGMTNLPEARLAREAEICYATLALATDYDCWHEEEDVSVEQILKIISRNVKLAQDVLRHAVDAIPAERGCACASALENAVITNPDAVPQEARERLGVLMEKYWQ